MEVMEVHLALHTSKDRDQVDNHSTKSNSNNITNIMTTTKSSSSRVIVITKQRMVKSIIVPMEITLKTSLMNSGDDMKKISKSIKKNRERREHSIEGMISKISIRKTNSSSINKVIRPIKRKIGKMTKTIRHPLKIGMSNEAEIQ